jgi:hypothetical protein
MIQTKTKHSKSHGHFPGEKKGKLVPESDYSKWLNRGASDGADIEDWQDAEQEMLKNVFERDSEN